MQFLAPRGRPAPADSQQQRSLVPARRDHRVGHGRAPTRRLREHHVEHASSGPQLLPDWNPNAGGIEAFYFRDPDGNHLEVLHFPPGKGDPKWQRKDAGCSSASTTPRSSSPTRTRACVSIATRSACASRATSENYGTEQEHLNNVFGAHLRITALRAAHGPGIELLEYLAPRTRPADARRYARRTTTGTGRSTATAAIDAGDQAIRRGHYADIVSPGPVVLGDSTGLLITRPDGHAVMIVGAE